MLLLFLLWILIRFVYGDLIFNSKPNENNDEICYKYRFHKHKRFLNNNNNNNNNNNKHGSNRGVFISDVCGLSNYDWTNHSAPLIKCRY